MKIKKNTRYLIETKEDLQDFLERCEKKGWKWHSKDRPLDFTPHEIPCVMFYTTESPWEGLAWSLYTNSYDKIYKRKTPPTLAEFLGWEEGVEYVNDKGEKFKINLGQFMSCHNGRWFQISIAMTDSNIEDLRSYKKTETKTEKTILTLPEWNALGINDTNADFEEVTE